MLDTPESLFLSSEQWREADLAASCLMTVTTDTQYNFPQLTKLRPDISTTDDRHRKTFSNAPCLRELSVGLLVLITHLGIPRHQLRTLTITRPSTLIELLSILPEMKCLEELSLNRIWLEDEPGWLSDAHLNLPLISTLSLLGEDSTMFMRHLTLPTLTNLHLAQFDEDEARFYVVPCLQRSMTMVTTLSMARTNAPAAVAVLESPSVGPTLKTLTITRFHVKDYEHAVFVSHCAQPTALPVLESFTVVVPAADPLPITVRPFLDAVRTRAANLLREGLERPLQFVMELTPYEMREEEMRDLIDLQRHSKVCVRMPQGRPAWMKRWEYEDFEK
ncbi:hypothetical protein MIND_00383900 [Mycena indigotica]|uniref:F-box domain-containing protein n=1 Tax=Mycena indigotica TaxID=2126181 RepID=A0A8H6T4I7_9AGAR|nr:uncharacterized protein MIND_00383900 [Mycena indigotica]KAF7310106.1 hypothetical protein MIND_00383900 [Mycena indigotica]